MNIALIALLVTFGLCLSMGLQYPGQRNFTRDSNLQLKDAGLVAASARAQVSSADKIIDLGEAAVVGCVMIDVTVIEIADNDEIYDIVLQGSPDSDFGTATNIKELCAINLSAAEVKRTDCNVDDAIGRRYMYFTNQINDTVYRYVSLYTVVGGTVGTGINYVAWITLE